MTYVDSKSLFSLFRFSTGLGGWEFSRRVLFVAGLLFISTLASPQALSAQPSKKVITKSAFRTTSIHAADLNGDGFPEVLFGAYGGRQGDGLLAWHENQMSDGQSGGSGFGVPRKVKEMLGKKYIATVDFDGDGDKDILAAFNSSTLNIRKISWFENRIGARNSDFSGFGKEKKITSHVNAVSSVSVADLDGDGDQDVIAAGDPIVTWYENQVGEEGGDEDGFGRQVPVSGGDYASLLSVGDINGDGDPDLLYSVDDKIAWHENQIGEEGGDIDGFGEQQTVARQKGDVTLADLDGDGDNDILAGTAWYENQGGDEKDQDVFGEPHRISNKAGASSVHAVDLDGDGDKDLLAGNGKGVFWHRNQIGYKNDESDGFGGRNQIITREWKASIAVYAADLDGDGNQDVLATDINQKHLYWIENTPEWTSPSK